LTSVINAKALPTENPLLVKKLKQQVVSRVRGKTSPKSKRWGKTTLKEHLLAMPILCDDAIFARNTKVRHCPTYLW
jgi:hypothetical protein